MPAEEALRGHSDGPRYWDIVRVTVFALLMGLVAVGIVLAVAGQYAALRLGIRTRPTGGRPAH